MISFNEPRISGFDKKNINKVLSSKKLIDGLYQRNTADLLKKIISSSYVELTQSGSNALEIASLLLNIDIDDEVIMPSFTFSATANSVALFGGKPVFADINESDLCLNLDDAEKLITSKTKAIYLVHYGGNCCDMDKAKYLKKKYNLFLVEDSAHSLFSKYKNQFSGTIGDIGIFSFHQTKNFCAGHGGAISVNLRRLQNRASILLDKGNMRKEKSSFGFYKWADIGSEYRSTEIGAALLYDQFKRAKSIQKKKKRIFKFYKSVFAKIVNFKQYCNFIDVNEYSDHSYHIVGLIFKKVSYAEKFLEFMIQNKIQVTRHYFPLHLSPYGKSFRSSSCKITNKVYKRLIRLPTHLNLNNEQIKKIEKNIKKFFKIILNEN